MTHINPESEIKGNSWTERIMREFHAGSTRVQIAHDPDGLLLDEQIIHGLHERRFEIMPFEDPIEFRVQYEERYRAAWNRDGNNSSKYLILHLCDDDPGSLPWDYLDAGHQVDLRLAKLFPNLSSRVVRQIDPKHYASLYEAHDGYAKHVLGEAASKEFILAHIFDIHPHSVGRAEAFWPVVMRLHFKGSSLPPTLADHVASIRPKDLRLEKAPIAELLQSKSLALRALQASWGHFLARYGIRGCGASSTSPDAGHIFHIPFDHPDMRAIIPSMFLDGVLQPISTTDSADSLLPRWAKIGLNFDEANWQKELVENRIEEIKASLPETGSSHPGRWFDFAQHLGETIYRFHKLDQAQADSVQQQIRTLREDADTRLKEWVFRRYGELPSLAPVKGPVMVHHIPRYLARRRVDGKEDRIALLVFDGLAIDQWIQIREYLAERVSKFSAEERACFAWLPTLTSVSRQAIFSGRRPREFQSSIKTTSREEFLWRSIWKEHGLDKSAVFYRKALGRKTQLAELEEDISRPSVKVAGIVVDMVDKFVHGAKLGKRGIFSQISQWCSQGFVEELFALFARHEYHIYLTADHGNVEAEGIGRANHGGIIETRGERVQIYRDEVLITSELDESAVFRFDVPGLPADFLPLYADTGRAFSQKGHKIVAHGGASVEELIVPFVKINMQGDVS